jgi:hypothetical protein
LNSLPLRPVANYQETETRECSVNPLGGLEKKVEPFVRIKRSNKYADGSIAKPELGPQ